MQLTVILSRLRKQVVQAALAGWRTSSVDGTPRRTRVVPGLRPTPCLCDESPPPPWSILKAYSRRRTTVASDCGMKSISTVVGGDPLSGCSRNTRRAGRFASRTAQSSPAVTLSGPQSFQRKWIIPPGRASTLAPSVNHPSSPSAVAKASYTSSGRARTKIAFLTSTSISSGNGPLRCEHGIDGGNTAVMELG